MEMWRNNRIITLHLTEDYLPTIWLGFAVDIIVGVQSIFNRDIKWLNDRIVRHHSIHLSFLLICSSGVEEKVSE